jgi:hypothetical protein
VTWTTYSRHSPGWLPDADRITATGCRVVQINTGSGCHLDAEMVDRGLRALRPPERSVVFIENVGNLVCPALFDLGEAAKIVITSTTEGADKPLKYPQMFAAADGDAFLSCRRAWNLSAGECANPKPRRPAARTGTDAAAQTVYPQHRPCTVCAARERSVRCRVCRCPSAGQVRSKATVVP